MWATKNQLHPPNITSFSYRDESLGALWKETDIITEELTSLASPDHFPKKVCVHMCALSWDFPTPHTCVPSSHRNLCVAAFLIQGGWDQSLHVNLRIMCMPPWGPSLDSHRELSTVLKELPEEFPFQISSCGCDETDFSKCFVKGMEESSRETRKVL